MSDLTPEQRKLLTKSMQEGRQVGERFINSVSASLRGKIPERLKLSLKEDIGKAIAKARGIPC